MKAVNSFSSCSTYVIPALSALSRKGPTKVKIYIYTSSSPQSETVCGSGNSLNAQAPLSAYWLASRSGMCAIARHRKAKQRIFINNIIYELT